MDRPEEIILDEQWWTALRTIVDAGLVSLQQRCEADQQVRRALLRVIGGPSAAHASPPAQAEAASQGARLDTPSSENGNTIPSPAVGLQPEPAAKLSSAPPRDASNAAATAASDEAAAVAARRLLTLGGTPIPVPLRKDPPGFTPEALLGPKIVSRPPPPHFDRIDAGSGIDVDWTALAQRCRLKAEACRWQLERSRRLDQGEDVSTADSELVNRARQMNCFLWMVQPAKWRERTEMAFEVVGGCYEALADAAEAMALLTADAEMSRNNELVARAMQLLAEAQSALRAAIEDYASTAREAEQEAVFGWLRRETDVRRVYCEFMQLDSPAPPANHSDLRRRIAQLADELRDGDRRRKAREQLFKKVAYCLKKLDDEPSASPTGSREWQPDHPQFQTLDRTINQLLDDGLAPSDRRLRELLLPALGHLPQAVSPGMTRVLEEVDRYLDQTAPDPADAPPPEPDAGAADPLLAEARRLTAGRHAVMMGGVPDEVRRRTIQSDLALESLQWLRIEHGHSFERMGAALRDPRVSLVFVMTRWRSHRDGPEARQICKERNIALVELTGGSNVRQFARAVIEQGSQRLGAA